MLAKSARLSKSLHQKCTVPNFTRISLEIEEEEKRKDTPQLTRVKDIGLAAKKLSSIEKAILISCFQLCVIQSGIKKCLRFLK